MGFFGKLKPKIDAARKTEQQARPQSAAPAFQVTGSMEAVGQVKPGLTSLEGQLGGLDIGTDALLYDEATGNLYKTNNWNDARKNYASLVGASGERQRVGSVSLENKDESTQFSLNESGDFSGVDIVYGAGESVPALGSDRFQEWLKTKFNEGIQIQAGSHKYSSETGSTGTGYGGFGSISWSDWVDLGRPGKVGNDSLMLSDDEKAELEKMSDDQIRGLSGLLTTVDEEVRHRGVAGALDSVGKKIGWNNMASDVLKVAGAAGDAFSASPFASWLKPATAAAIGYDSGGWRGAGKAVLNSSVDTAIDAGISYLTVMSVGALAPVVGGGIVGGAAAGGVVGGLSGAAGSALKYGTRTSIYGGADSGDFWREVGTGSAVGAASGAVGGGLARAVPTSGAGNSAFNQVVDRSVRSVTSAGLLYAVNDEADPLDYALNIGATAYSSNSYAGLGDPAMAAGMTHDYAAAARRSMMSGMLESVPLAPQIAAASRAAGRHLDINRISKYDGLSRADAARVVQTADANGLPRGYVGDVASSFGGFDKMYSADMALRGATGGAVQTEDLFDNAQKYKANPAIPYYRVPFESPRGFSESLSPLRGADLHDILGVPYNWKAAR